MKNTKNNTKNKTNSDFDDPILEIRVARDIHAKTFNYDLALIFEDLVQFQKEKKLATVSLPTKKTSKQAG